MEAHSSPVFLEYNHAYVKEKYANLLGGVFLTLKVFLAYSDLSYHMPFNSAVLREEVGATCIYLDVLHSLSRFGF